MAKLLIPLVFDKVSYWFHFHQLLQFPIISSLPISCACVKYWSTDFSPNFIFESLSFLSAVLVVVQASHPYVRVGIIIALYSLLFVLLENKT